jgi:enolase
LSIIKKVQARQILDSRGNPTIEVDLRLDCGSEGRGIAPSGASTGKLEALELRDGDKNKFLGKSVYVAIDNVNNEIKNKIINNQYGEQEILDNFLIDLDGTENKGRLGANAILAVSLAFSHAMALSRNLELYEIFSNSVDYSLPVPLMNILNGGAHADNSLDFQEFMILPLGFDSFKDSLRAGVEIFHNLKEILSKFSYTTAVGDEGGFAPNIKSNEEALDIIIDAINASGYNPGKEVFLGLDVASSEFYNNNQYLLTNGKTYDSKSFCRYLEIMCKNYPILSIEDGMAEDDWQGWTLLTETLGSKVQLVGDDVFVTNPSILKKGIENKIANSILIKFNQIGTISETIETINIAKENNYNFIISHRSGETEDTTISDLSVGMSSGQIKTGSLSRSDRTAKYNRLLRIEEKLGSSLFNSNYVFDKWLK